MTRYIKAGKPLYVETPLWEPDDSGLKPHLNVSEHKAVDTGLVWPTGEKIMRTPNPIGFGRDREW